MKLKTLEVVVREEGWSFPVHLQSFHANIHATSLMRCNLKSFTQSLQLIPLFPEKHWDQKRNFILSSTPTEGKIELRTAKLP